MTTDAIHDEPTDAEQVTCPTCKSDVLIPREVRTITIAVEAGVEPVVDGPGFLAWEMVAILERATSQARTAQYLDDSDSGDEDDDDGDDD